jgi:hypothetical protein
MKTFVFALPVPLTVDEVEENRLISWAANNRLARIIHRIEFEPIDRLDRQWAADLAEHFAAA